MENKDVKTILNYLRLLNSQVLETSDNELLIDLINHIDDVCKYQIEVIDELEED